MASRLDLVLSEPVLVLHGFTFVLRGGLHPAEGGIATAGYHTDSVECVKWGGSGLIYSGSRDRSIKVWRVNLKGEKKLIRTLNGHAHRVNTLALNCDYICRTGAFSHSKRVDGESDQELYEAAVKRYNDEIKLHGAERLASGSNDFTMYLWEAETSKKPLIRLTGHQQLINHALTEWESGKSQQ